VINAGEVDDSFSGRIDIPIVRYAPMTVDSDKSKRRVRRMKGLKEVCEYVIQGDGWSKRELWQTGRIEKQKRLGRWRMGGTVGLYDMFYTLVNGLKSGC